MTWDNSECTCEMCGSDLRAETVETTEFIFCPNDDCSQHTLHERPVFVEPVIRNVYRRTFRIVEQTQALK